jgi:hypothetical protein
MNSSASPEWHRNLPRCANDARCSAFIDYLVSRGYSRNTISAFGRALESALEMAGPVQPLEFNRTAPTSFATWPGFEGPFQNARVSNGGSRGRA